MTSLLVADQIAALRGVVFEAVAAWNADHPHRLRAHQERASVHIAHVFSDAAGAPTYAVTVECTLAGSSALTFHGTDLAGVIEHARLTVEHRIDAELHRRADRARHAEEGHHHKIAV